VCGTDPSPASSSPRNPRIGLGRGRRGNRGPRNRVHARIHPGSRCDATAYDRRQCGHTSGDIDAAGTGSIAIRIACGQTTTDPNPDAAPREARDRTSQSGAHDVGAPHVRPHSGRLRRDTQRRQRVVSGVSARHVPISRLSASAGTAADRPNAPATTSSVPATVPARRAHRTRKPSRRRLQPQVQLGRSARYEKGNDAHPSTASPPS
jgi:hypothetical protein